MESSENVRKAFAPLGERLHFFEAGLHLVENNEHDIAVNQHDFFYIDMIDKVGRDVNSFDSSQVYMIANEYLMRTIRVQKIISEQLKCNKNISTEKWKMWEDEIYDYLNQLFTILDVREEIFHQNRAKQNTNVIEKKIVLPDGFSIKEMQTHFKPKFNHSEIAMLMYYMSKVGILPPYERGELGKIAPVFGFHEKTIPEDIRHFNPNSKTELIRVKKVAEALLQAIDEDLTKAPKR